MVVVPRDGQQHPEHGFIAPDSFIPIAEEIGMIGEISDWVFDQAAREAQRCRDITGSDFQMSVNMSAARFRGIPPGDDPWLTKLRDLELPGHCMIIEITEGVLMNNNTANMQKFAQYRDAGVQIAVDDFGTGYSALASLKMFDVDYLKIDKSFTMALTADSPDLAVSEAIVVMAHKLGLQVIAEGVETTQQLNLLKNMGCDYGQGYLFSRPLPAEAFEALLSHPQPALKSIRLDFSI